MKHCLLCNTEREFVVNNNGTEYCPACLYMENGASVSHQCLDLCKAIIQQEPDRKNALAMKLAAGIHKLQAEIIRLEEKIEEFELDDYHEEGTF